ncbi:MAG: DUF935 domain-containing protein [Zoogloeaceae bacterium]|jgi:phage gp29-like protein|nr:DUF935 domain-containing protein [Zoogloeaceae bacterium]
MSILDQYGHPIKIGELAEPQTSRIATLQNLYIESHLEGISPASAARMLADADNGDILAQHQLFDDMIDRDAHLACEFGKRTGSVLGIDWSIEPPKDASKTERDAAAWVEEILRDAVDDLDDVIGSLMEAVGHGFAMVELSWKRWGGEWLPGFHPRPQTWFQLSQDRRELRLRDASANGAELYPFGWIFHAHQKAKTGYLGRAGICRCLIWPFIYKYYAVGDFAEFLETYGLPIILGKYYAEATPAEKASLMRAVTRLGHDARATMPKEMEIEIEKITGAGDGDVHLKMVDWAERSQSKIILGQTLSAEAKATGMGSGLADLHNEVRHDILKADARKLAATLTRDLVYPLLALNGKGGDALRRCPRWVFDLGEADDIKVFAESLPTLAANGAKISVAWVHEKLRIPMAEEGEELFGQQGQQESGDGEQETGKPEGAKVAAGAAKYDASMINAYSMGIDRFVRLGMAVPEGFVRDVFSIPRPQAGDKLLEPMDAPSPLDSDEVEDKGLTAEVAPDRAEVAPTTRTAEGGGSGTRPPEPSPRKAALKANLDPNPETLTDVDRLVKDTAPLMENWLSTLEAMLESAESLEEFREMLLNAFPKLDTGPMAEALTAAGTALNLRGRFEVEEGK